MKSEKEPIRTIPDGVWEATHTDNSAIDAKKAGNANVPGFSVIICNLLLVQSPKLWISILRFWYQS